MKKLFLLILLGLFATQTAVNAQKIEDVFNSDDLVWFGLDFSHAKMIDPEGFSNPAQIVQGFFRSWNNIVVNEPNRYDLKQSFRKRTVSNDLSIVTPRNSQVDPSTLVLEDYETHELSEEIVRDIIKEYDSDKSGLGLVFVVESFNKVTDLGTMYVTFFDIETRVVFFTKKISGETGGFGLRNYWARTIRNVIEEAGEQYSGWRREYMD